MKKGSARGTLNYFSIRIYLNYTLKHKQCPLQNYIYIFIFGLFSYLTTEINLSFI